MNSSWVDIEVCTNTAEAGCEKGDKPAEVKVGHWGPHGAVLRRMHSDSGSVFVVVFHQNLCGGGGEEGGDTTVTLLVESHVSSAIR